MPKSHKISLEEKKRIERRILIIGLAALLGMLLAAGLIVHEVKRNEVQRQTLRATALNPKSPMVGGPFTLINQDGKTMTDADFRGKYMLIYFGYTFCPDMCPTGLQSIARALDLLGGDMDKVAPLFITIDPARDTPAKLKSYVATFHPKILGLTGSAEQVAAAAKAYQVYYAKQNTEDAKDDEYMMDHSSLIYLMDPEGKFLTTFQEEAEPKTIVKALRDAFAKNTPLPAAPPPLP